MKRRNFIQTVGSAAGLALPGFSGASPAPGARKIFIFGGGRDKAIMNHIVRLTGKENPKVCLLPTATGDSPNSILSWYNACEDVPMRPFVMRTYISSYDTKESFEDTLMKMDAVFVGGGNTLNMIAIWKAQGIDIALRKAYEAGILMTGGSAGSLCWFENGTTDSRPKALSKVECLGWLKGSHCPHYDAEEFRRPLYHELIGKGELPAGYACDNKSGIYFENEKMINAVSATEKAKSYYVELVNGKVVERELKSEWIK